MTSLVAVFIAGNVFLVPKWPFLFDSIHQDNVPLRDVAMWRSFVNMAATMGRSSGGPLGGFFADTIGWRWYTTILECDRSNSNFPQVLPPSMPSCISGNHFGCLET